MVLLLLSDKTLTAIEPHLPRNQLDAGSVTRSIAINSTDIKIQSAAIGANRKQSGNHGAEYHQVLALSDVIGRPYALMLTSGNVSDIKAAPALPEHVGRMRYQLGNKGFDADSVRRSLLKKGAIPVIPGRCNRKRTIRYNKQRYRGRHLVENAFYRLKDFRRVATRYDNLAANFLSAVALATAVAFWV